MAYFGDIVSSEPKESYFLPPGVIMPYAGTSDTAPDGWLFCNGFSHSRTTYANLYSTVGDAYGAGNGSTTFNVPDMRRRFVLGFGTTTTGTAVNTKGGAWDHTHSGPAHTHNISHDHDISNHTHEMSHTHDMSNHVHGMSGRGISGYITNTPGNNRFMAAPDVAVKNPFTGNTAVQPAASNPFQSGPEPHGIGVVGSTNANNTDGPSNNTTGNSSISNTGGPNPNTTGSMSTSTSGTAGTGDTGSANPPYITLQYIIKT